MKSLYTLIKNISKSEKRHFKLSINIEDTKYAYLFNTMERMAKLDKNELIIKLELSQDFNFKYLSVDLKYLHKKLLHSLKTYHLNHSASFKIRNYLDDIEVLFSKGMLSEALHFSTKCKKLIIRYELLGFIFELSKWEYKILGNISSVEEVIERSKLNLIIQDNWQELEHFNRMYFDCNVLRKIWPQSKLDYNSIIDENPIENLNEVKTFRAKIRLLQIHQLLAFLNSNKEKELILLDQINQIIDEEFKDFKEEDTYDYVKIFSRYLYLYLALAPEKISSVSELFLSLPKQFTFQNEHLKAFVNIYTINFILSYYIEQKAFDVATEFLDQSGLDLNYYRHKSNQSFLVGTIYKSAFVYFCNGNFDKALDYINLIVNTSFIEEESDVLEFSSLLNLFIHYELGNFQLVLNLLNPTHKYFKRSKIFKNNFKEIFKLLQDFCAFEYDLPSQLVEGYVHNLNTKHKELIIIVEKYFAINEWLNSKLLNQASIKQNKNTEKLIYFSQIIGDFEK